MQCKMLCIFCSVACYACDHPLILSQPPPPNPPALATDACPAVRGPHARSFSYWLGARLTLFGGEHSILANIAGTSVRILWGIGGICLPRRIR